MATAYNPGNLHKASLYLYTSPMSELALLGDAIRQKRKAAGFNQEQVAEATGLTQQSISEIERGNILPSWFWLLKFSKMVKTSTIELLREAGLLDDDPQAEAELVELFSYYPEAHELFDLILRHREDIPKAVKILKAALEEE